MLRILEPGDYFGETIEHYGSEGLSVVETRFADDLIIPEHEHVNAFFCFVLAGRGTRSWATRAGDDAPMSLTFFPAGLPHANCWHGAGGRVLHLEFASAWLEKLGSRTGVLHRPGDFARGAPLSLMRRLAVEIAHQDGATPLAVEGLVLELVAACARCESGATGPRASSSRRWLARAEALLRERFQAPLSLDYIASEVHVSADHLAREFRKRLGCTVGEYVRDLRLEFAAGKLVHSDEPLAQIAEAAGFADQSHFTRVFRRKLGVTPGAYRLSKRTHR